MVYVELQVHRQTSHFHSQPAKLRPIAILDAQIKRFCGSKLHCEDELGKDSLPAFVPCALSVTDFEGVKFHFESGVWGRETTERLFFPLFTCEPVLVSRVSSCSSLEAHVPTDPPLRLEYQRRGVWLVGQIVLGLN